MALEAEQIQGDGGLVNALSSAVKRRTRRRLSKVLEGVSREQIAAIDFSDWRIAVRAMAQSVAIDQTRIEFGEALTSVASRSADETPDDNTGAAALPQRVARSREAGALLRRAIGTWLNRL